MEVVGRAWTRAPCEAWRAFLRAPGLWLLGRLPPPARNPVPEPATYMALLLGLATIGARLFGPVSGIKSLIPESPVERRARVLITLRAISYFGNGGMAEWLMAAVLKTVDGETRSGVRIPLPPPA